MFFTRHMLMWHGIEAFNMKPKYIFGYHIKLTCDIYLVINSNNMDVVEMKKIQIREGMDSKSMKLQASLKK